MLLYPSTHCIAMLQCCTGSPESAKPATGESGHLDNVCDGLSSQETCKSAISHPRSCYAVACGLIARRRFLQRFCRDVKVMRRTLPLCVSMSIERRDRSHNLALHASLLTP